MTTKEADQIIKTQKIVTLHSKEFDETFKAKIISRGRFNIRTESGGVFDRVDLEIIKGD